MNCFQNVEISRESSWALTSSREHHVVFVLLSMIIFTTNCILKETNLQFQTP